MQKKFQFVIFTLLCVGLISGAAFGSGTEKSSTSGGTEDRLSEERDSEREARREERRKKMKKKKQSGSTQENEGEQAEEGDKDSK